MREDIKKRRSKYEKVITPAMRLFHDKDMIVERKAGMVFVHFRYMQSIQKRALNLLFKQPSNRRVEALMRPTMPSLHLLTEVAKHKAIKYGQLEQVIPEEGMFLSNIVTGFFNFIRSIFTPQQVNERIPQLV